jgi:hypothetical protein
VATLPWQHISAIDPELSYVASPGLITFSMRAVPSKKNYWTLSVWANEAAIHDYISKPPHVNVMRSMAGRMGNTAFKSWSVKGSDLPLAWAESINLLEIVAK